MVEVSRRAFIVTAAIAAAGIEGLAQSNVGQEFLDTLEDYCRWRFTKNSPSQIGPVTRTYNPNGLIMYGIKDRLGEENFTISHPAEQILADAIANGNLDVPVRLDRSAPLELTADNGDTAIHYNYDSRTGEFINIIKRDKKTRQIIYNKAGSNLTPAERADFLTNFQKPLVYFTQMLRNYAEGRTQSIFN